MSKENKTSDKHENGNDFIADVSERSSFENAMYWYLKGFEDAETTESQPVSHEQTMKDAETHFHLVWDCYVNAR